MVLAFIKLVTNKFWSCHEEKEKKIKQKRSKNLIEKFYKQNKYNFILNKHYQDEEEKNFIEKEKRSEKLNKARKWTR